jgi:hypothetical protein
MVKIDDIYEVVQLKIFRTSLDLIFFHFKAILQREE